MGDRYLIPEETIKYILELISYNFNEDLFVVNLEGKVKNIPIKKYNQAEILLTDLGPIMTCISTLILSQRTISGLELNKFDSSAYPHFCSIFEYLNGINFSVIWNPKYSVMALKPQGLDLKNWSHDERALSIGCRNWVNSVFSLSADFSFFSKISCIKNFGVLSNLFTFRGIALMRLRGNLTYSNYKKYSEEIGLIIKYPKIIVMLMSIFPRNILKFIYTFLYFLPVSLIKKIGIVNLNE